MRRSPAYLVAVLLLMVVVPINGAEIEPIPNVEQQPFVAATQRLMQALEYVGVPLSEDETKAIREAMQKTNGPEAVSAIQKVLDPHVLAVVRINAESRVSATEGPVEKELVQQGWRTFLVKVHNEAGITPELVVSSSQSAPVYEQGRGPRQRPQTEADLVTPAESARRWKSLWE